MEYLSLSNEIYQKKKFYAIDVAKFVFSFAIISLHYPASWFTQNPILNLLNSWFARLAVPFFFIASGYFLFKKLKIQNQEEKKDTVKRYLKKIGKMYLIWTLLNLPLIIRSYQGCSISYIVKKIFLLGTYRQFWYLQALILDVWLIYYCNQKQSPFLTLMISIVFYMFATIGLEFYEYMMQIPILKNVYQFICETLITPRNAIFFGFCFMAMGNFLASCNFKLSRKKAIGIFVLTSITITLENIFFTKTSYLKLGDMRISLVPLAFCCFYIVAHIELKPRKIYLFLRNMSILIFCSHCLWAECLPLFFNRNLTVDQEYLCSVVASFLFAFLTTKIKEMKKARTY